MPKDTDIQALEEKIALQKRALQAERAILRHSGAKALSELYSSQAKNLTYLEKQLQQVKNDAHYDDVSTLTVIVPRAVSSDAPVPAFLNSLALKGKTRGQSLDDVVDSDMAISNVMGKK